MMKEYSRYKCQLRNLSRARLTIMLNLKEHCTSPVGILNFYIYSSIRKWASFALCALQLRTCGCCHSYLTVEQWPVQALDIFVLVRKSHVCCTHLDTSPKRGNGGRKMANFLEQMY